MTRRRDTGPGRATRTLITQRAGGCCELCGLYGGDVHHRTPRGIGGSTRSEINEASNLLLLCRNCHAFIETIERASAYTYGWLCPQGTEPGDHPVLILGRWVYLTGEGTYVPAPDDETEVT